MGNSTAYHERGVATIAAMTNRMVTRGLQVTIFWRLKLNHQRLLGNF